MGAIRTGIYSYYTARTTDPLYLDVGTRFYYNDAPEQETVPYCVFHVFTEIPDWTFDLSFENAYVQFDYIGSTANECDDGIADIKTMFDYAELTISGYSSLKLERDMVYNASRVFPQDVWKGSVRYTLLIQEN